ncbi:MAG: hypothetical protein QM442_04380, partial [Spirochaetota bacterium]|nr:hypothetical protein [Spirochaetota bacterium]
PFAVSFLFSLYTMCHMCRLFRNPQKYGNSHILLYLNVIPIKEIPFPTILAGKGNGASRETSIPEEIL